MCLNCNYTCIDDTPDGCLLYTGPDFPRFNIKSGEYYNKIIVNFLEEINKYVEQKVQLNCLYNDSCDEVDIPEAIQIIIDKLCMLTSADIKYTGNKYCIGNKTISGDAVSLLGKHFTYKVEPAITGTSITYDLNEIIKNLPSTHKVGRVNTVISGKPKRGKSIIADTNKPFAGITVENDRFPVNMDVDMRINTPSGDVKMLRTISIPSPMPGSYTAKMNVQDFSTNIAEIWSLESFLEANAAQVCANTVELDSYKNMKLPGCEEIQYVSTDVKDIIAQHSAILCSLIKQLKELNNVSFSITDDKCGDTNYNEDLHGAINVLSKSCSSLNGKIGSCNK